MGGQDLLPPAKAGGARRTRRSTIGRQLTALTITVIIVCLLYATQRSQPSPPPPPLYPVGHGAAAASDAAVAPAQRLATTATSDSSPSPPAVSPPPSPGHGGGYPGHALTAASEKSPLQTSPSVISLKLQAGGGKEHTLRLRLLPEHSAPSVEFMRCATHRRCGWPHLSAHALHICAARVHTHVCAARMHTHVCTYTMGLPPPTSAAASSTKVAATLRLQPAALRVQVCRRPPVQWRALPL